MPASPAREVAPFDLQCLTVSKSSESGQCTNQHNERKLEGDNHADWNQNQCKSHNNNIDRHRKPIAWFFCVR